MTFVPAPAAGDIAPWVATQLTAARAARRDVLVYVAATWCAPCQEFHEAAKRGALDQTFPRLTLLEFDLDRDGTRLAAAGYVSDFIPLFAVPSVDGRSSGRQIQGVKTAAPGEPHAPAVPQITTRLAALLTP